METLTLCGYVMYGVSGVWTASENSVLEVEEAGTNKNKD